MGLHLYHGAIHWRLFREFRVFREQPFPVKYPILQPK